MITDLHSSMERLKVAAQLKADESSKTFTFQYGEIKRIMQKYNDWDKIHLHSSMERLKVQKADRSVASAYDLHSSMERLKARILRL